MLKPDNETKINGVKTAVYLLHNHNPNKIALPPKRTKKLIGVTIHNTADLPHVDDDAEQYTRSTINGNMRDVRVHYYVDDIGAWQNLPLDYVNWSCADGYGQGNTQTIAIECIMDGCTGTANLTARDNCARLAAWLLYTNGLSADDLYTHSHWLNVKDGKHGTREKLNVTHNAYKNCPYYILPYWSEFEAAVCVYYNTLKSNSTTTTAVGYSYKIRIKDDLNVRSAPGTTNPIKTVIHSGEVYTIVEESVIDNVKWGKLKSGIGWVSLVSRYSDKI